MHNTDLLPTLALFTLIAVAIAAVVLYGRFMRKRENRHPLGGPHGHELEARRARQNAPHIVDTPPTRR